MAIPVSAQLAVSSGGLPPLVVNSSALCLGLNADLLDGLHSTAFAPASHVHSATAITSDTLASARAGSDPINGRWLRTNGTSSAWTTLSIGLVSGVSSLGAELVGAATEEAARNVIQAAPSVHTHTAVDVTAGTFAVERLGSGSVTSAAKVLRGSDVVGGSAQWYGLQFTDVAFAVGATTTTVGRLPYWFAPGFLKDSPFLVGGSSVTMVGGGDFGTNGTVTCNDLIVNYAAATNFKTNVYTKVASTVLGSASVVATPNGAPAVQTVTIGLSGDSASPGNSKLYGTNASGVKGWYAQPAGGSSPPTTPANAVYVWVVNSTADGGDWLQLLGAE